MVPVSATWQLLFSLLDALFPQTFTRLFTQISSIQEDFPSLYYIILYLHHSTTSPWNNFYTRCKLLGVINPFFLTHWHCHSIENSTSLIARHWINICWLIKRNFGSNSAKSIKMVKELHSSHFFGMWKCRVPSGDSSWLLWFWSPRKHS